MIYETYFHRIQKVSMRERKGESHKANAAKGQQLLNLSIGNMGVC